MDAEVEDLGERTRKDIKKTFEKFCCKLLEVNVGSTSNRNMGN